MSLGGDTNFHTMDFKDFSSIIDQYSGPVTDHFSTLSVRGGAAGVILACLTTNEFRPLRRVLKELPPYIKKEMLYKTLAILGNLSWRDASELIVHVMHNPTVKAMVVHVLQNFIKKELKKTTSLESK